MRIQPSYLNLYNNRLIQTNVGTSNNQVSFKSANLAVFMSQMGELENVHCPLCGTKMLSGEELKELLEQAEKISAPSDFVELLKKNKESIRPALHQVLNNAHELLKEMPDSTLHEFYGALYKKAYADIKKTISASIIRIREEEQKDSYCDSDKMLLEECKLRLKHMNDNAAKFYIGEYKKILQDTIAKMHTPEKWKLYESLKEPVKDSILNLYALTYGKANSSQNRSKVLVNNIFNHSSSRIKDMVQFIDEDYDKRCNKILVCDDCSYNKSSFFSMYNSPKVNKTFSVYQADIAKNILKGKLKGNEDYPFMIEGFAKKITKGNIDYERDRIITQLVVHRLKKEQSEVNFIPVEFDGVPCAGCGKHTINHEHKLRIYKEIEDTKNLWQLVEILDKYKRKISDRNEFIVNDFKNILEKDPLISQKQLILKLRESAAAKIKGQLRNNEKIFNGLMEKYRFNESDRQLIKDFVDGVNKDFYNFEINKKFHFGDYSDFIRETIAKAENPAKYEFITQAKEPVKTIFEAQSLLFPPDSVVEKLQSLMKPITQNILNGCTATTDYIIPKEKNGTSDKYNCMVLCRDCNKDKSNYSFAYWYKLHPEFEKNVKKYMKFLVNLINEGKIKNFSDYPKIFAAKLKKMTYNKIILRFDMKEDNK